jgi:CRP-like cAMP-binding protein
MEVSMTHSAYEKAYKLNETIIKAGETGNEFYQVISGKVGVYINYGAPNQLKVAELSEAEYFGEAAILGNAIRSATVAALGDTRLLVIPLQNIERTVEQYPSLFLKIIRRNFEKQANQNKDLNELNRLIEEMCSINDTVISMNAKIVECLNSIQTISKMNTILGINAQIEAARAGKQAGGFAVVAEEMQRLAKQTAEMAQKSHLLIDECTSNSVRSAERFDAAKEFLRKFR